jgi:hypothetical protein
MAGLLHHRFGGMRQTGASRYAASCVAQSRVDGLVFPWIIGDAPLRAESRRDSRWMGKHEANEGHVAGVTMGGRTL